MAGSLDRPTKGDPLSAYTAQAPELLEVRAASHAHLGSRREERVLEGAGRFTQPSLSAHQPPLVPGLRKPLPRGCLETGWVVAEGLSREVDGPHCARPRPLPSQTSVRTAADEASEMQGLPEGPLTALLQGERFSPQSACPWHSEDRALGPARGQCPPSGSRETRHGDIHQRGLRADLLVTWGSPVSARGAKKACSQETERLGGGGGEGLKCAGLVPISDIKIMLKIKTTENVVSLIRLSPVLLIIQFPGYRVRSV